MATQMEDTESIHKYKTSLSTKSISTTTTESKGSSLNESRNSSFMLTDEDDEDDEDKDEYDDYQIGCGNILDKQNYDEKTTTLKKLEESVKSLTMRREESQTKRNISGLKRSRSTKSLSSAGSSSNELASIVSISSDDSFRKKRRKDLTESRKANTDPVYIQLKASDSSSNFEKATV